MEALLSDLYANSTTPIISAILLGLLMAIAPCPLTINITAIGFIGKDLSIRKRIFYNGLFYALGTIFSYFTLSIILYIGADQLKISTFFQQYSEKILGPLLVVIGILMLGIVNINFPAFNRLTERFQHRKKYTYWDAFVLGLILALAFCPYSGVLFFGMLIPLTISASSPALALIFSLATAIPVVLFAWLLAFTLSGVGKVYGKLKLVERIFRKIIALLFLCIGIYYIFVAWI